MIEAVADTARVEHRADLRQRPAPRFSVVIPTYNEERDIGDTIDHVLAQTIAPIDVIVVDGGSVDDTIALLRGRPSARAITIIEEGRRRGVAAARNTGIRAATGDVVVILNADVLLPPDFLARLIEIYRDGDVDLLSVNSRVSNLDAIGGRYMHAAHQLRYGATQVGWSEDFSCRREAALAAGFPEEIPGAGGEDVEFVDRLLKAGYRWKVDYAICVDHRVPPTLAGFWDQCTGRGRAVPYIEHAVKKMPLPVVTARRALSAARTIVIAAVVVPNATLAVRLARRSPRGLRDAPALWLAHHVLMAAHRAGEWRSLRDLWSSRGQGTRRPSRGQAAR